MEFDLEKRAAPEVKLALEFPDGKTFRTVTIYGTEQLTDSELDETIALERRSLEQQYKLITNFMSRPPSGRAVERYLAALRDWIVENASSAALRSYTFDVSLVLANSDDGNAADVDTELGFPRAFS